MNKKMVIVKVDERIKIFAVIIGFVNLQSKLNAIIDIQKRSKNHLDICAIKIPKFQKIQNQFI